MRDAHKKPKVVGIALGTKGRNLINLSIKEIKVTMNRRMKGKREE